MSRTLTAMFDSRADAEAARSRLEASSIDISRVHVHDQASTGYGESSAYSTHQDRGFWADLKSAFLPDEDRHTYEEGIRRGGALLTAEVDEDHADEAVRVLEGANSVDLDDRTSQWRQSGWDYDASRYGSAGGGMGAGAGLGLGAGALGSHDRSDADMTDRLATGDRTGRDEERIDIVEEELVVGKREVGRGGVRVRSYVVEKPVHEQVRLREEHVDVERRPVDRKLEGADADAFREREISVTETNEEAVVGKTARVVEEVVVRKEAGERVENIDETVRRTEVDIDDIDGARTSGATGAGLGGTTTDRDRF